MSNFGLLMIIFGLFIMFAGVYLALSNKGSFTEVLLWKSNSRKMTREEIAYVGKIVMLVSLSPIITGILAISFEGIIIPITVLLISFILFLIIGIKLFK